MMLKSNAYLWFDFEKGHLFPIHWLFIEEKSHTISPISISTPSFSLANCTACWIDKNEFLLQHLAPPISPIALSEREVMRFDKPNSVVFNGVDPVTMEINIPELIPAPQAPQNPQAPPGTLDLCSRQRFYML